MSYDDIEMIIPPDALYETTEITIIRLLSHMVPYPFNVPLEYDAIIKAFYVVSEPDVVFSVSVYVSINYSNTDLDGGFIFGLQEVPPIEESGLQAFFFNYTSSSWKPIPSVVDTLGNTVTFNITEPLTLAIGGPAKPVGGVWVPVDKLTLLASYIALALTTLFATAAIAIYVKRVKRRKEKQ